MTSNSSDDDHDARARVSAPRSEGERANAAHWRAKADRDTAALQALRRKTSVRVALNLERQVRTHAARPPPRASQVPRGRSARLTSAARTTREPPVRLRDHDGGAVREDRRRWGDWHFARDLAGALERLGYSTRIYTADHAATIEADDCRRAPRGAWARTVPTGRGPAERAVDHQSPRGRRRTRVRRRRSRVRRVGTLRGRTAHRARRRPSRCCCRPPTTTASCPARRIPRYAHPLTFVAKTREVLRPIVADALAAGLRPTIYGSGWEGFVDPDLIAADYVSNDCCRSSTRRPGCSRTITGTRCARGASSRTASSTRSPAATPVVSDHLPEIADLFGSGGRHLRPGREAARPSRRGSSRRRGPIRPRPVLAPTAGRARVLAAHTFDHRARTSPRRCTELASSPCASGPLRTIVRPLARWYRRHRERGHVHG